MILLQTHKCSENNSNLLKLLLKTGRLRGKTKNGEKQWNEIGIYKELGEEHSLSAVQFWTVEERSKWFQPLDEVFKSSDLFPINDR